MSVRSCGGIDVDVTHRPIFVVTIDRPHRRNAVDAKAARGLYEAFRQFDEDDEFSVAILRGAGGTFCAGADLKAMVDDSGKRNQTGGNSLNTDMNEIAPMGCTRLQLRKPVIAAVSGHAVAGGLELALWCDLRVADDTAIFGVFCRMRGVPLIDGGTIRLPRLIGLSAASDLILTGREVKAEEAKRLNLVNYLATQQDDGQDAAHHKALEVARLLASHPQRCMRNDRLSMLQNAYSQEQNKLMSNEFAYGLDTLRDSSFGSAVQAFNQRSKL